MPSNFTTIFVEAVTAKNKGMMKDHRRITNGDQLARDVQATILEQETDGMDLISVSPITSSNTNNRTYTQGVLLVFKKVLSTD